MAWMPTLPKMSPSAGASGCICSLPAPPMAALSSTTWWDDGAQQVTRLVMFQSQRSVSAPPRRLIVTPTEIPTVAEPSPLSLDMGRNYGSQLGIQPPSESLQLEARLRAPSLGISAFHNMIRHKISSHLKTPSLSSGQLLCLLAGHLPPYIQGATYGIHVVQESLGSLEASDDADPGRYELFSFKPSFS
ncbi:uncharacterized protein CIMG_00850 [Coccidioides immitis RS]|uniref:Uncharacterized protein n=1 Tax=Coccidioides immitis (strain RS) TaxID=246410 RepID=J3KHW2_COCIM|nr:uncharacterized protein CIMG_00850 [Coccidioides immitis RS]EAS35496.3 hypothetical protein CIMG_00850 [Coccidioides immitis RS]